MEQTRRTVEQSQLYQVQGRSEINPLRLIYGLLFTLCLPFVIARVFWRARKEPRYKEDLRQRLGYVPESAQQPVWVHGVSAGETIAAAELVRRLVAEGHRVLFTNMTPAGRERAEVMFTPLIREGMVTIAYAPYDAPFAVNGFYRRTKPKALIVIDTELWPNIVATARRSNVPVFVVNGRLSRESARGYKRLGRLSENMFSAIEVFAQTESQGARFRELGCPSVVTAGSIKFDAQLPEDFAGKTKALAAIFANRNVLLGASTHEGEEEVLLEAYQTHSPKDSLLVLAPRHVHRVETVLAKLDRRNLQYQRHSSGAAIADGVSVYVLDTMGELIYFYGICANAFVGGSLVDVGGHNPMEPGSLSKPMCMGPYRRNIADIADQFETAGALCTVNSANDIVNFWRSLESAQAKEQMAAAAEQVMARNKGALDRILEVILLRL